ncbi:aldehyde dehydrogenase family protein [Nocardia sp. NPDC052001]|uniref:aldehyde dehydrogenase family protein n=1 Tax=Nocardia sp. NPDC052001 TaxID=3154853 RepID=UPI00342EF8F3
MTTHLRSAGETHSAEFPTVTVTSPLDGRTLNVLCADSSDDVRATATRLRDAQPRWEQLGLDGRSKWLDRYRNWLLDNADRITGLLHEETGKAKAEAPIELGLSIDALNYYNEHAAEFLGAGHPRPHSLLTATKRLEVNHRPYPLVGVISPWNYPLALALFDALPALIAGAAVLLKPSSETPLAISAAVAGWEEIGAPPVFATVVGAGIGSTVVDVVDYVQFTGSTATGRTVAQQAASRLIPYGLELGGKDPAIVLADANVVQAAAGIAFGGLSNSGQMCTAVERVYVEAAVHDEFVDKLVEVVAALRQCPGGPDDGSVDLGAMVTESQVEVAAEQVRDAVAKGAVLRIGGSGGGHYFEPTVLTGVDHSMRVMTEETFGPILPVMRVRDADEAIRLANGSDYGLSASVWTRNLERGKQIARRLEVGSVDVNDVNAHLACFPLPMSGWKDSGAGGGRLGGAAGIRKYCRTNTVTSPRIELSAIAALLWFPYSPWKTRAVEKSMRLLGGRNLARRLGI